MTLADFTRDPDLIKAVRAEIESVYDPTSMVCPDPSDVIADVLAEVREEIRGDAEWSSECQKVDDCTAKAVVRRRLADYLEGWPVVAESSGPSETARWLAVEAAAVALMVKIDEHRRRQYDHIRVGVFDDLRAALNLPAPLSTAARLDALDVRPVDLPSDTDGAA